jgi:hypothetical protein
MVTEPSRAMKRSRAAQSCVKPLCVRNPDAFGTCLCRIVKRHVAANRHGASGPARIQSTPRTAAWPQDAQLKGEGV